MNSGKDQNRAGSNEEGVVSDVSRGGATLDLGISDLIVELEQMLKGGTNGFAPSFSERGRYYQNLVVSGAFEQLSRSVDADLVEHGENDILTRVYWIHSRHVLDTFPRGMLGMALNRVIRQINDLLKNDAKSEGESTESDRMDSDIKAATSALASLVPMIANSLPDSPELVASIQEAWNELDHMLVAQKKLLNGPFEDVKVADPVKREAAGYHFFRKLDGCRAWFDQDGVHGFCKGLFLLLSPLLIYALWSQSRPGGVGSQALNWIQGQEPLIRLELLGPRDEIWLPPDGTRRWKELEVQKAALVLPVLARIDKLEGLQEISYSLEGKRGAQEIVSSAPTMEPALGVTSGSALPNADKPETSTLPQTDSDVVTTARNQVVPVGLAPGEAGKAGGLDVVDTSGPVEPEVVEPEVEPVQTPTYGGEFPRERYFVTRGRSEESAKGMKVSPEEPGDYYEIRVPTFIFEHPSFSSFRIAELEVGDEVLGKEIIGRWIKVVSYNGGIGFLPVNDARRAYGR